MLQNPFPPGCGREEWSPEYVISAKGVADMLEGQRYVADQQFGSVTILAKVYVVGE